MSARASSVQRPVAPIAHRAATIVRTTARPAALILATLIPAASAIGLQAAEGPASEGPPAGVVVCDDLVGLRRLMAAPDAAGPVPGPPGCRRVEVGRIGPVVRRAIVGGMPFECVALDGGACVWPLP